MSENVRCLPFHFGRLILLFSERINLVVSDSSDPILKFELMCFFSFNISNLAIRCFIFFYFFWSLILKVERFGYFIMTVKESAYLFLLYVTSNIIFISNMYNS